MPKKKNQKIKPRKITEEMKESYMDYAMSVIISRALPDVRDGLKPVHRRILYSMYEMGLKPDAKFRKSATVVGECFIGDTKVLTKRGLVPIQKIKIGDQVYTQNGLGKVIRLYEMPKRPLLKITLENGISNTVTPSQKFKVLTSDWKFEWKGAKDLTKDDYLVVRADYPEINKLVELNRVESNHPKHLKKSIAYLLGILISDASASDDYGRKKLPHLNFGATEEVAERMVSTFKKEFNYLPTIEEEKYQYKSKSGRISTGKRYQIRINRKSTNEFFVSNFELEGLKASTKKIPLKIFRSAPNVIFSFLSGLIDGAGVIDLGESFIQYGSTSEELIDGLLTLLLHQGIFGSKYVLELREGDCINGRKIKRKRKSYSLEVRGINAFKLAKHLNLASEKKKFRIERIIKGGESRRFCRFKYDLIPYAGKMVFGDLRKNHLGGGWYRDTDRNKFRMGMEHGSGCKIRYSPGLWEKPLRKTQINDWGIKDKLEKIGSPLFRFLEEIVKNEIYFIKVSSIRKVAPQKTYDLEVENDHEFIANGMVSHNCLGKFHPHGDQAVYDAAMRMAQDFSLRYPLIQGQGNVGSVDDPGEYAAMRYTEMKLSKTGEEMLRDIEKNTVDFIDNYDGTRKEPTVLPSPLPQLLLNGCLGIAVGTATEIPPHNLSEIVDATVYLIDHPRCKTKDLFKFIQGPDFPTGGIVYDKKGMISTYSQGRGPIVVRGKAEIKKKRRRTQIVITEIPFRIKKADLVQKFANLVKEKRLPGVKDIRDESGREGLRIVLEISSGGYPKKILNRLYKFTRLQDTFHLHNVALVKGIQPRLLSLKEILRFFIGHRKKVVKRRTSFNLKKAKDKAHILEGFQIALKKIDDVIKEIKKSSSVKEAEKNLQKSFKLTKIQSRAILAMKLSSLAKLEREKVRSELKQKKKEIKELSTILKSPKKIKKIVKNELKEMKKNYGDERRTKIYSRPVKEIPEQHLIPHKKTIITLTQGGYIKRISPAALRRQRRGGKGVLGMRTVKEDMVTHFLTAKTLDSLLFFTTSGKVFKILVYKIPRKRRVAKGKPVRSLLNISQREKILSLVPLRKEYKDLGMNYLVVATKKGIIKKTALEEFENVRKSGLIAIKLKGKDLLQQVRETSGEDEIMLVTKNGLSIRFREEDVRPMGRAAAGVKGIRLKKGDKVVAMEVIRARKKKKGRKKKRYLLVVTEAGYGKRTELEKYRVQKRGGIGLKTAKITKKTGKIVTAKVITSQKDLVVISQKGKIIRMEISSISVFGRNTQGVRIMKLERGDRVASITVI